MGGADVEVEAEAPTPIAVAFKIAAGDTADLPAGRWRWSLIATDPALENTATITSGTLEVHHGFPVLYVIAGR